MTTTTAMLSCLDCKHHQLVTVEDTREEAHPEAEGADEHNCIKYPDIIGAFPNSCYNARFDNAMCGRNGRGFEAKDVE